jgi:hypothetical protein
MIKDTSPTMLLKSRSSLIREFSVSSTITVDNGGAKPVQLDAIPAAAGVHFDLSNNKEYSTEAVDEEDLKSRWFHSADFKKFKASYIRLSRKLQQRDRENTDPQSFKTMLYKCFYACRRAKEEGKTVVLSEEEEDTLQAWLDGGSRTGLERFSVHEIIYDKSVRRRHLSAKLLAMQDEYRLMLPEEQSQDLSEQLRFTSERVSRTSRLFAWRIAQK